MSSISSLIDQNVHHIPSFTLECGADIRNVPVAYKTWGTLNETRDNVMVICHAFTGSADVEDWWGPLMGRGKAFDPHKYFIFCGNVLGSPYGTASPVTINPATGRPYGPEFPPTTIRDDVRLHKLVLDALKVSSVAVVVGGSMGGMAALEYPLCTPPGYVKHIIPLATCARHSAWGISWGEAQRQSIFSDPGYLNGYYGSNQPASGLAAARMAALLTYRSRDSFETRFGRRPQIPSCTSSPGPLTPPQSPKFEVSHNDGHRNATRSSGTNTPISSKTGGDSRPSIFSAQSYLRYQGDKFTARFDANCYIHITRKMDSHDLARDRSASSIDDSLAQVLSTLPSRALVIGIASDGLFTLSEQRELAAHIPNAHLVVIQSPDGHDGFLLEFEQINLHILRFLKREYPQLYKDKNEEQGGQDDFAVKKTSIFGEAEVDITQW